MKKSMIQDMTDSQNLEVNEPNHIMKNLENYMRGGFIAVTLVKILKIHKE